MTFRWCCVRVKASEIAFVGFGHLPVAGSNSLPFCVGMSPTTPYLRIAFRFWRKNRVSRKERGAPVSRCAFAFPFGCVALQRLSSLPITIKALKLLAEPHSLCRNLFEDFVAAKRRWRVPYYACKWRYFLLKKRPKKSLLHF